MTQYKKSGPPVTIKTGPKSESTADLKELIKEQSSRIDFLERELRRLKARVDDATSIINKRNG